jgi:hypothetical protein
MMWLFPKPFVPDSEDAGSEPLGPPLRFCRFSHPSCGVERREVLMMMRMAIAGSSRTAQSGQGRDVSGIDHELRPIGAWPIIGYASAKQVHRLTLIAQRFTKFQASTNQKR